MAGQVGLFGVLSGFLKGPEQKSDVHSSLRPLRKPSPSRGKLVLSESVSIFRGMLLCGRFKWCYSENIPSYPVYFHFLFRPNLF